VNLLLTLLAITIVAAPVNAKHALAEKDVWETNVK
jgi:hypothetical protein